MFLWLILDCLSWPSAINGGPGQGSESEYEPLEVSVGVWMVHWPPHTLMRRCLCDHVAKVAGLDYKPKIGVLSPG